MIGYIIFLVLILMIICMLCAADIIPTNKSGRVVSSIFVMFIFPLILGGLIYHWIDINA